MSFELASFCYLIIYSSAKRIYSQRKNRSYFFIVAGADLNPATLAEDCPVQNQLRTIPVSFYKYFYLGMEVKRIILKGPNNYNKIIAFQRRVLQSRRQLSGTLCHIIRVINKII